MMVVQILEQCLEHYIIVKKVRKKGGKKEIRYVVTRCRGWQEKEQIQPFERHKLPIPKKISTRDIMYMLKYS